MSVTDAFGGGRAAKKRSRVGAVAVALIQACGHACVKTGRGIADSVDAIGDGLLCSNRRGQTGTIIVNVVTSAWIGKANGEEAVVEAWY